MKFISREVKMYKYVFANIDLETGTAVNMQEIFTASPMGQRALKSFCEEHNNAVLIHKDTTTVRYAMPLDLFVKACEEYSVFVADGTAPAITENDEIEEGSEEDID